jgi:hypothetical protein
MHRNASRSCPADELRLDSWEVDRYLIDRRSVCTLLWFARSPLSIHSLYTKTKCSPNNLARILLELQSTQTIFDPTEGIVALSPIGRARLFAMRRQLFTPNILKTWEIPTKIGSKKPKSKEYLEKLLPKKYRVLKVNSSG